MGRHGGSLDNIVALFIVAVVAVMVAMGLLMAPYFIYKFAMHISRVGLQALETYVLDIGRRLTHGGSNVKVMLHQFLFLSQHARKRRDAS